MKKLTAIGETSVAHKSPNVRQTISSGEYLRDGSVRSDGKIFRKKSQALQPERITYDIG